MNLQNYFRVNPLAGQQTRIAPSRLSGPSGFGSFWSQTKGTVLGIGAGVLVGVLVEQAKSAISLNNKLANAALEFLAAPASASITTLIVYNMAS